MLMAKRGLYSNIHAKRERIKRQKAAGKTPEKMRKKGAKGAPTDKHLGRSKNSKKPTRKRSRRNEKLRHKKTCADCPTPSTCAKVGCIKKMIGDSTPYHKGKKKAAKRSNVTERRT